MVTWWKFHHGTFQLERATSQHWVCLSDCHLVRTRQYRDDDHQEDPPHFSFSRKSTIFSVTSHQVVIWLMKLKKSTSTIGLKILLVLEINLLLFNFIEFIYLFIFLILDWSRSADRHWVLSIKKPKGGALEVKRAQKRLRSRDDQISKISKIDSAKNRKEMDIDSPMSSKNDNMDIDQRIRPG